MPMKFRISSPFGDVSEIRDFVPHTGMDIPLPEGTKLRSFVDGTVSQVLQHGDSTLGKAIVIHGEDGNTYTYGHLSKIVMHVGDKVQAGRDIIGLSGNTGRSTGPHLHLSVQLPDGSYVDPAPALHALESVTGGDPFGKFIGDQPMPGSMMDHLNKLTDKTWSMEKTDIWSTTHPVLAWLKHMAGDFGHWFTASLPDLMGYGAMLTGALVILASAGGKGAYLKPLVVYGIALIVAVTIRLGGTE